MPLLSPLSAGAGAYSGGGREQGSESRQQSDQAVGKAGKRLEHGVSAPYLHSSLSPAFI